MKRIAALILYCAAISASAQIGSKIQQQTKVAGVWHNNQFGYLMVLILNQDGRGEFDGEQIRYVAKDGKLSITIISQNQTTSYSYLLNANTLTVSGGDLEQPVVFAKPGATSTVTTAPVATGAAITAAGPPTVTSGGTPPQTTNTQPAGTPDQGVLGKWAGNGEEMEFRADGKCTYNGAAADYQASKGHLLLTSAQGTSMMAYVVSGNLLRLTINGAQYTYTRVEPSKSGAGVKSPGASGAAARVIPADLAGKWCKVSTAMGYSSTACIVLNANGTYTYNIEGARNVSTESITAGASQNADQGTWWVEADRIFYNSTAHGQGSYGLEKKNNPRNPNDPMIVLDGDAYVTATVRLPWR